MKHLHLFMITIASYNIVLQAAKMPESKSSRSENSSHLSPIIKPEKRLIAQPSMLQTIKSSMQSFIEYFLGSEKNSSETITELKSVRTSDLKLQQKIN